MIVSVDIHDKTFGNNTLYHGLELSIEANERVGLIGRNGTGKTTLFNIIMGLDKDFAGHVQIRKNTVVIASRQEHHGYDDMTVLEYILADLPEYAHLKHIIETYPAEMSESNRKMQEFSDALERFAVLDYYTVEEKITRMLADYQLGEDKVNGLLGKLSGGQKRFVELVKVQRSMGDVSLIDEPTNHMDYIAKEAFLEWFKSARGAVVVITHDRDVLEEVDRIIEIRDGKAFNYKGGYSDYLRTNATRITGQVNEYAVQQRRISNLRENIIRFQRLKEKSRDPGTISRFKSQENRARKELAELEGKEKPSFWIDRESAQNLNAKMTDAYAEHKAKNIKVRTSGKESESSKLLVDVSKLSLGYRDEPLFSDMSFQLREGERLRLHGRNGAGKSTLVRAILAKATEQPAVSQQFSGTIAVERDVRIGVYEQEVAAGLLDLTLAEAIEKVYDSKDVPIPDQKIMQLLSDYLFNPATDGAVQVGRLSGGQKARLQLISMLAGDPQVLILDEPTNHLDLPSIEELENALSEYKGAIIYISHDSYFSKHIGGETITIAPAMTTSGE
jgi:ATP-binding cassette subfamily F protein 3